MDLLILVDVNRRHVVEARTLNALISNERLV